MEYIGPGIEVVIIDRHALFCHGLRSLLHEARPDWRCTEAANISMLQARLQAGPDVLVMLDLHLPDLDGPDGLRRLSTVFPRHTYVALADSGDRNAILGCLAAGAQGYVLRSASPDQVLHALDTVLAGGMFAPASLASMPVHPPLPKARVESDIGASLSHLTNRQRDVFRLLAEGCATKTIAQRLDLAVGTVKVHLAAIYRTLGARSRLEALAKVHRSSPVAQAPWRFHLSPAGREVN
jgi:DNA-binding NarL/FixJ family response regulator